MSKSDFLNKLAALLHILQEDEVRDIIDEYEQHIDIKLAQGMSEKEVLDAFGSVEELAGEILSAYHVRPDIKSNEKKTFEKVQGTGKKALDSAGSAVKNAGTKTGSFVKRIWDKLVTICKTPFIWIGNKKEAWKEKRRSQKENSTKRERMSIGERMSQLWKAVINMCKSFIKLLIRIIFGCLFTVAGFGEICLLISIGLLIVLLGLGYPVLGITVAAVGAAMAMFVVTYYSAKKMKRR